MRVNCVRYPNDSHGTVALPTLIDGLKFIFVTKNFLAKRALSNPNEFIPNAYKEVNEQTGFPFQPEESVLITLEKMAEDIDTDLQSKFLNGLLKYHLKLYPQSEYAKKHFASLI